MIATSYGLGCAICEPYHTIYPTSPWSRVASQDLALFVSDRTHTHGMISLQQHQPTNDPCTFVFVYLFAWPPRVLLLQYDVDSAADDSDEATSSDDSDDSQVSSRPSLRAAITQPPPNLYRSNRGHQHEVLVLHRLVCGRCSAALQLCSTSTDCCSYAARHCCNTCSIARAGSLLWLWFSISYIVLCLLFSFTLPYPVYYNKNNSN